MKHATLHNQYLKKGNYVYAAVEAKRMKQIEMEVFAEIVKDKRFIWKTVQDKIAQMTSEDVTFLNITSNALRMLSDVFETFILDTNIIMKKYGLNDIREYDKLKIALKEAKECVRTFDTLTKDEKVITMFGDCADDLYKLVFNKASSYVGKVRKYEENINKKAARDAEVA